MSPSPGRIGGLPARVFVLYDWSDELYLLQAEEYGHDSAGFYYKAKRPDGGTIEVHVLEESYFQDHPDAGGQRTG